MDNNTNKKKRRFPIWATVLCIILAVILLIGVGVFAFIQIQLSKINKYDPDDVVVVAPEDVDTALEILRANGEDAYVIGEIIKNDETKIILE